ncbi:replication A protein, partial [Escherichia coli]
KKFTYPVADGWGGFIGRFDFFCV